VTFQLYRRLPDFFYHTLSNISDFLISRLPDFFLSSLSDISAISATTRFFLSHFKQHFSFPYITTTRFFHHFQWYFSYIGDYQIFFIITLSNISAFHISRLPDCFNHHFKWHFSYITTTRFFLSSLSVTFQLYHDYQIFLIITLSDISAISATTRFFYHHFQWHFSYIGDYQIFLSSLSVTFQLYRRLPDFFIITFSDISAISRLPDFFIITFSTISAISGTTRLNEYR
jgi:hypothetical protein